jgi:hypothetical protein
MIILLLLLLLLLFLFQGCKESTRILYELMHLYKKKSVDGHTYDGPR